MRRVLKQARVSMKFEHAKPNPRMNKTFRQQSGQMLMKECDERSKAKRKALASIVEKDGVETTGPRTLVLNQCLKDKNIQALVREVDAEKHELRAVKDEHPETWQ